MNCHDFQEQLYEYVEGSLSPPARAAAEAHLARCEQCGRLARQEEHLAAFLSASLHHAAAPLTLASEFSRRLASAPSRKIIPLRRWAWPIGIAASVLLLFGLFGLRFAASRPNSVAVDVSYHESVRVFHREGNRIVDTLTLENTAVSETLWTHARNSPL